jgi:glutathione S-transferase
MPLKLYIGNKAYSSWSFRPWILMKELDIAFEEQVIPLYQPQTARELRKVTPSAKVPVLKDGDVTVWESVAIFEYLNERFPKHRIWPRKTVARAHARALCAEMHAGFTAMRSHLPTNFRREVAARDIPEEVAADVARIETAWAQARKLFGSRRKPFLYGRFSAADAMFAPVVNRLHIYDVPVKRATRDYMDVMLSLPSYQLWLEGAAAEPWVHAPYEL